MFFIFSEILNLIFTNDNITPIFCFLFNAVNNLLFIYFFLPFIAIAGILFLNNQRVILLNKIALYTSAILFFISVLNFTYLGNLDLSIYGYTTLFYSEWIDLSLIILLDNLSLMFIVLTNILIFLCLLYNYNNIILGLKEFIICLFLMQFFLNALFLTTNIFWFFIFFECVLIPMFFIIGIWGSRLRKIHATYYFYLYTLFGSLFMLIALIVLYSIVGSGEFDILYNWNFNVLVEVFLFIALFFSFAIKVPVLPLHIWLPEAHVEAPTTGSVLLAGVLLKLGTYGILRILIPVLPFVCITLAPVVYLIGTLGIVYASFAIMRQIDLKKIIAYSSVIHMNYALIGLFTFDYYAIMGSIFLMINHGIVSSGLFFLIGMLYERYHSRLIIYYGGLNLVMPLYSLCFVVFSLANIGFPGTSSFVGEFLVLLGAFDFSFSLALILNISVISSVCYMLWTMNRILYGPLKYNPTFFPIDITIREFLILVILLTFVVFFGLFPEMFFANVELTVSNIFQFIFL